MIKNNYKLKYNNQKVIGKKTKEHGTNYSLSYKTLSLSNKKV